MKINIAKLKKIIAEETNNVMLEKNFLKRFFGGGKKALSQAEQLKILQSIQRELDFVKGKPQRQYLDGFNNYILPKIRELDPKVADELVDDMRMLSPEYGLSRIEQALGALSMRIDPNAAKKRGAGAVSGLKQHQAAGEAFQRYQHFVKKRFEMGDLASHLSGGGELVSDGSNYKYLKDKVADYLQYPHKELPTSGRKAESVLGGIGPEHVNEFNRQAAEAGLPQLSNSGGIGVNNLKVLIIADDVHTSTGRFLIPEPDGEQAMQAAIMSNILQSLF